MALMGNPFTSDLNALFQVLAQLTHYQGFVRWQLGQAKEGVQKSLDYFDKKGWDRDAYFAAHGTSLMNMFHPKIILREPIGGHFTKGSAVLRMSEEMERKFNSFMLVYTFEAFERYLKEICAKLLYYIREENTLARKKDFHAQNTKMIKLQGTATYFEEYVKWACSRTPAAALGVLTKELNWDRVAMCFYKMTFDEFVSVIAFCRHCIVHNEGRVWERKFGSLSKKQKKYVELCLRRTIHSKEIIILPPNKLIDQLFEFIASYAWTLYILISERCGMRDETHFFGEPNTVKKTVKK